MATEPCAHCGDPIRDPDSARLHKDRGWMHAECYDEWHELYPVWEYRRKDVDPLELPDRP